MKYRILVIAFTFLLLLGIIGCSDASCEEYTISTDENFISTQSDDDLTAISEKLNTTPKELDSYLSKNDILYLAVSKDNKSQIKISAFTDNFSSKVGDMAYLNDDELKAFITAVSEDSSSAKVVENGGRKYLRVKDTLKDNNGVYTVTQYITIYNDKTFYLAASNSGSDTSAEIKSIFKSFNLKESTSDWTHILINCGIVLFGLASIAIIISIVITHLRSSKVQGNDKENFNEYED